MSFFAKTHGQLTIFASKIRSSRLAGLSAMVAVFLLAYWLPFDQLSVGGRITSAGREALLMLQEYAREHVLLCLVPALFIAGAIAVFVSQAAVIKYFGAQANKVLAYCVASVSGTVLAACSCTILPLFAGIYTRGAGIGPATAFLYSGPAINVLAIILTARVLGWELGLARALGAVVFSIVIGLCMQVIYRREEQEKAGGEMVIPEDDGERPLWKNAVYFALMIGILVFANWKALDPEGIGQAIASAKWIITGVLSVVLAMILYTWFRKDELGEWVTSTWRFAKQILPLLFVGVLVAGLLLGRPGHPALVPERWIAGLVGGNSIQANLFASVVGAFMYFATLTEVPILEGLLGAGMGQGPALALLLAGPALSLPNMLVIRSVLGTRKTIVYVILIVIFSTIAGITYGSFFEGVA
jgi:hypothetical protein